ncbi:restriction endonuclease [Dermabacteraceae bacterium CCM 9519]
MSVDLVPPIDVFRPAVLRALKGGEAFPFRDLCTRVADQMQLSNEAREQCVPSGQPRYINRITWACSSLNLAGLVRRPKRGWYEITADGRVLDARGLHSYSEKEMLEWPAWANYQGEIADRRKGEDTGETPLLDSGKGDAGKTGLSVTAESRESVDPVEAIESGVQEFNAKVETELRRALQEASPEFFEKAVIELLWAMGYGGAHGEKQHVGKTHDGGIDGLIRQDALGLQNVYIQAKRYADDNPVQAPAIQQFYGALGSRQGADRGVFITTSRFTKGAVEQAARYHDKAIVLIDGLKLTSLMLSYGVAVQKSREFTLYTVDEDFFDQDLV